MGTWAESRFDSARPPEYKWRMQAMKNIYEVMWQKEADIERLKRELHALRVAALLLEEELAPEVMGIISPEVQVAPPPVRTYATPPANGGPVAAATKPIWP